MNRAELDAFFERADDVLTDWHHSEDSFKYVAPEVNFDCPELPRNVSVVALVADAQGLDGWAARAILQRSYAAAVNRQVADFQRQMLAARLAFERIGAAIIELGKAASQTGTAISEFLAAYYPQPPVADPWIHALDMKRQRGTGPAQRRGLDGYAR